MYMDSRGICYVVYGEPARREAARSIKTLAGSGLPVTVFGDRPVGPGADWVKVSESAKPGTPGVGRQTKTRLFELSPFDSTLYIDADIRLKSPRLLAGFDILESGFDLVIAPSGRQWPDNFQHLDRADRAETIDQIGTDQILQLQAGLFWFGRSDRVRRLFEVWQSEWLKFQDQDQGTLVRALDASPVKIWLLGKDFNNGCYASHHFGKARGRISK